MMKVLFCLALCLVLAFFEGCEVFCLGCQKCTKYQDVAVVRLEFNGDSHIDSVIMKENNSIIGCKCVGVKNMLMIGSKTHNVKFPINIHLQLFSQGNLLEELSFEMDKNMMVNIYKGSDCSEPSNHLAFLTDDYCLYNEKMNHYNYGYGDITCMELNVDGE